MGESLPIEEIVNWLIHVEKRAENLYRSAAVRFGDNHQGFGPFLRSFADDEAWHAEVMARAADYLHKNRLETEAAITLDKETMEKVERQFSMNCERLSQEDPSEEDLLRCIVACEYSEWNDLFLYVVNALKNAGKEFQHAAAKLQQHREKLEGFIKSRHPAILDEMGVLPSVWETSILVVDDSPPIVEMLASVLGMDAEVETAQDGKEGFEKTSRKYFDLIISDLNMPVMNGIEFYTQAVRQDPTAAERFLFFTADPRSEDLAFFERNEITFLLKPSTINEIRRAVREVLEESSREKLRDH